MSFYNTIKVLYYFRFISPNEEFIANCLWINSHFGVGCYIYNKIHLQQAPVYQKILYSSFGSVIFNFGTLLFWVSAKKVLPDCPFTGLTFGLMSSCTFLFIGSHYLSYVDKRLQQIEAEIPEE